MGSVWFITHVFLCLESPCLSVLSLLWECAILHHLGISLYCLEKTLILGKLKAGGEGDDRGRDGWMVSLTQWTWVWASSGRWWRTGRWCHWLSGHEFEQALGDGEGQGSLSDWTTMTAALPSASEAQRFLELCGKNGFCLIYNPCLSLPGVTTSFCAFSALRMCYSPSSGGKFILFSLLLWGHTPKFHYCLSFLMAFWEGEEKEKFIFDILFSTPKQSV